MKRLWLFLAAMLLAVSAWATSYVCRIDETALYFTGKVRTDRISGTLLYEHRCWRGHYFWLTQREMYE